MTVPTRTRSHDRETGPRPPRSDRTRPADRRAGGLDGVPSRELFLRWQRERDQEARHAGARGRPPTRLELAEYLELDVEQALEALRAGQAYRAVSLEAPRTSDRDGEAPTLADGLGSEDERYELVDADASIAAAMKHLAQRERAIVHLRFAHGLAQTQIATQIGLSPMQVSRIVRRSLERLRILVGADQDSGPT
ncbi:MAG TPA: sigma-70 family RNA polymerase sigma factor [Solirubrobacteraceae bacterium]|nr:sigma-70 family RNA polymerase sigma factor [Solirubrobacteraceae bacterium]